MNVLVSSSTPKASLSRTAVGSTRGCGAMRVRREMMRADQLASYAGWSEIFQIFQSKK